MPERTPVWNASLYDKPARYWELCWFVCAVGEAQHATRLML